MANADKRAVPVFICCGSNLLPLLINVNTELFNSRNLRITLGLAFKPRRYVLKGDGLNFVGLVLPRHSNQTAAHSIYVVARETQNLR